MLDQTDKRILEIMQTDCRTPSAKIAASLGISKSTIHYRIRKMEKQGIIKKYCTKIDASKVGIDYLTIVLIRAKYGPHYHQRIGEMLAKIPGVLAVYFVLGETDFIVLMRSKSREDFMSKHQKMTNMVDIERTNTQVVAEIMKEDGELVFDDC
jgi:DNA-binding Lrp family transcriptional regulator